MFATASDGPEKWQLVVSTPSDPANPSQATVRSVELENAASSAASTWYGRTGVDALKTTFSAPVADESSFELQSLPLYPAAHVHVQTTVPRLRAMMTVPCPLHVSCDEQREYDETPSGSRANSWKPGTETTYVSGSAR